MAPRSTRPRIAFCVRSIYRAHVSTVIHRGHASDGTTAGLEAAMLRDRLRRSGVLELDAGDDLLDSATVRAGEELDPAVRVVQQRLVSESLEARFLPTVRQVDDHLGQRLAADADNANGAADLLRPFTL